MLRFLGIVLWSIIGYLFGSVPWALVIGKVFFHKDVRQYGSHNLGGINAGRVLGKPIGALVIVLDALKAFIAMAIANKIMPDAAIYTGFFAIIGHCFPVFAQFRGGKGVASTFGYLLGIGLFVIKDPVFAFIYPVLVFFLVLGLSRMVSLSSMIALVAASVIMFLIAPKSVFVCTLLITLLVIVRHINNIQRIIQRRESKVSFLK
ncbi:MAG: glycerol-3-phosphate 1-O-acyltransferase PlsY [Lachnospiraceae bacterium]|nr:glycerol-3-phosphate 1-O-acyltransferase PlsY [Lachnospiraceae bacterium]